MSSKGADLAGRVYIFGAGASLAATEGEDIPLPLVGQFFLDKYTSEKWPNGGISSFEGSVLAQFLEQYFSFTPTNQIVNIEEVLSFCDMCISGVNGVFLDQNIARQARRELVQYIGMLIRHTPKFRHSSTLYDHFVDSLGEEDSLVTFNWDTLLKKSLENTDVGKRYIENYMYIVNPSTHPCQTKITDSRQGTVNESGRAWSMNAHGLYITMHGAVDLAVCTDSSCVRSDSLYVRDEDDELISNLTCPHCGSLMEVGLLPPTVKKSYAAGRFYQLQASLFSQRLSVAEEIVVVGYSLPASDIDARSLIRMARLSPGESKESSAFLKRIIVVDPAVGNLDFIKNIKELFGIGSEVAWGFDEVELITFVSVDAYLKSPCFKQKSS